jgi:hypothetical protein
MPDNWLLLVVVRFSQVRLDVPWLGLAYQMRLGLLMLFSL